MLWNYTFILFWTVEILFNRVHFLITRDLENFGLLFLLRWISENPNRFSNLPQTWEKELIFQKLLTENLTFSPSFS